MAVAETRYWLSSLPQAQHRLLRPDAGPLLAPLRSEVFGPQRLARYARSLGSTHAVRRAHWAEAGFFPRLRDNIAMFRLAQQVLQAQGTSGGALSPAAHWLLDNAHLVNAQVLAIQEDLPRSDYFRTLPVLRFEPLAGLPRIYGVASAFVAHTDSEFDEDLLVQWLVAYQETCELQLGEMWALPTMLRVVLLENLRRLAERLATHKAVRALANHCCDAIERGQLPPLEALLAQATQRGRPWCSWYSWACACRTGPAAPAIGSRPPCSAGCRRRCPTWPRRRRCRATNRRPTT